jgi:hypothetical protein
MYLSLAISELQRALEVAKTNSPLYDEAGNDEQAVLCDEVARQCQEAILVLKLLPKIYLALKE